LELIFFCCIVCVYFLAYKIFVCCFSPQWNISDYFYQQRAKITSDIIKDEDPSLTSSDQLWMCLYSKFGELCVDPRPAVRKSAGQTLFSTIAAHGDLLQNITWKSLLWKVKRAFFLLVKNASSTVFLPFC